MNYRALRLKNNIENFFILPFILIGRAIFIFHKKKRDYDVIFFFPFYHTGGAEKVHVQITEAVGNERSIIFFTKKSKDETFLESFRNSKCEMKDISGYTDNKLLYFLNLIYRGYISALANSQGTQPIIFNGQSNFGYKISPWINKEIVQFELIHALNTFSFIRIPFIHNYRASVTVSQEIIDKHYEAYKEIGVPDSLFSNFIFIETKIQLPAKPITKDYFSSPLRVLYVGRGTEEKRVQIVAKIAESIFSKKLAVEFHFAGDVLNSIPSGLKQYCIVHGNISNEQSLNELYEKSHLLIVASSTESGPLVIMEAMARGLAIITTDVGFVPKYMENGIHGIKIPAYKREDEIVALMAAFVEELYSDRNKLETIGTANLKLAYTHFDLAIFKSSYRSLFKKYRQSNEPKFT